MDHRGMREAGWLAVSVGLLCLGLGIAPPAGRFTWLLENFPVLIGLPVLIATCRRWPLTPLLYRLLAVHAVILMVGGHYTYAAVPAGDWVRDWFGLARNPYDRLGHLAQGFVPVILIREICLRRGLDVRGWFGSTLLVLAGLGISASYEILEWRTAVAVGSAADDFLGSQGDVWDAQWDMACCGVGAVVALFLLVRTHDRQLQRP
jgi:putative membrane protein